MDSTNISADQEKKQLRKDLFENAAILAAVGIASHFASVQFQAGALNHYGIAPDLVDVSILRILQSFLAMFRTLVNFLLPVMLFFIVSIISGSISLDRSRFIQLAVERILMIAIACSAVVLFLKLGADGLDVFVVAGLSLFWMLFHRFRRNLPELQMFGLTLLLCCVSIYCLPMTIGRLEARNKTDYSVFSDDGREFAVVSRQNDFVVAMPTDKSVATLGPGCRVIKLENIKSDFRLVSCDKVPQIVK